MKKVTYAVLAVAAMCSVGLFLAACGSSNDGSSSSQSPSTNAVAPERSAAHLAEKSKERAASKPLGHDPKARGANQSKGNAKPTPKKSNALPAAKRGARTESQEAVPVEGCVTGMTKSQCKTVGKAYEQQRGSAPNVVKEGECPGGLSEKECRQAGEAIEEGREGRVVRPDECPQAMTAAQCAEAGRAYEEATK